MRSRSRSALSSVTSKSAPLRTNDDNIFWWTVLDLSEFPIIFCWLLLPPWFNWWTGMQFIMFDNNCVWIFRKFPYFTYFTKTSWSQSTTTFAYIFIRDLPAIYLFVLHQMRTLRIMTLIGSTTSAHISITWKFYLLLSLIFDQCLPSFADSKRVDLFIGML